MIYTLMHKNIKVIDIEINDDGKMTKCIKMHNHNHMPVGTYVDFDKVGIKKLNDWFINRTLPISREGYDMLAKKLNINYPTVLPLKSYGLSLSDQYWLKEENDSISWDDINFFDNDFSLDLGDLLLSKYGLNKPYNLISPDSSSNGDLKKRWKIINGRRVLLKSGTKPYFYEVFNELIASKIMDRLDINHIKYYILEDDNNLYSACDNFINSSKDLVPIYSLMQDYKMNNSESFFNYFIRILDSLNIDGYREELDKMLFIDYLIGNVDRHLNNFGLIRNAKTLEFEAIAPIYDSGSSLGYSLNDTELEYAFDLNWKPFKSNKIKTQLDLIKDFSWLDINKLNHVEDDILDVCLKYDEYISDKRRKALIKFIRKRVDYINDYLGTMKLRDSYYSKLDLKILDYAKINGIIESIDSLIPIVNKSHITIQRSINKLVKVKALERIGANKNGYWKYID